MSCRMKLVITNSNLISDILPRVLAENVIPRIVYRVALKTAKSWVNYNPYYSAVCHAQTVFMMPNHTPFPN